MKLNDDIFTLSDCLPFFLIYDQVRARVTGFTGSIQTAAQQLTRSKLSATCKLSAEVGPYLPQRSPQASSSSSLLSHQWPPQLRTQTPRVISIQAWGTGTRSCSALLTSILSGLFTTGRPVPQTSTRQNSTSSWWGKVCIEERTCTDFTSTAQVIPKEIRKEGISPLKDCTSDQTLGSRKATSILTNGLTFGITWIHKETTISTLIAARHWAQSASRATVICTSQSGWWCANLKKHAI